MGLVVPRYKQSAVARNRLKRRLRELSRLHLLPADLAADLIVRIRPDAYGASFELLALDIMRALGELKRWRPAVGAGPELAVPPTST